jgi:hypothetical protein
MDNEVTKGMLANALKDIVDALDEYNAVVVYSNSETAEGLRFRARAVEIKEEAYTQARNVLELYGKLRI